MCDQTEFKYLPKEVVWVKISKLWWPAEVQDQDELEPDILDGLKKKPLAVVKFFNEDAYEFVGSLTNIYHYNCLKKDDFIQKGLNLLRGLGKRDVPSNITKFPEDVAEAERRTGGNPNIVNDDKFLPEQRIDYNEIFFNPKKTKGSKNGTPSKNSSGAVFKSGQHYSNKEGADFIYHCNYCSFGSNLVGTIKNHEKFHYKGTDFKNTYTDWLKLGEEYAQRRQANCSISLVSTPKVKRKSVSVTKRGSLTKKRKSSPLTPSATPSTSGIKKTPRVSAKEKPKKVSKQKTDAIRNRLIKDWAIDLEEEAPINDSFVESSSQPLITASDELTPLPSHDHSGNFNDTENGAQDVLSECPTLDNAELSTKKARIPDEKSCFDFEDNDDSIKPSEILKFGQKLPRVINEKRVTTEATSLKNSDSDVDCDIEKILEETAVPDLPDVPGSLPNFTNSFPELPSKLKSHNDDQEKWSSEVTEKLIPDSNPKIENHDQSPEKSKKTELSKTDSFSSHCSVISQGGPTKFSDSNNSISDSELTPTSSQNIESSDHSSLKVITDAEAAVTDTKLLSSSTKNMFQIDSETAYNEQIKIDEVSQHPDKILNSRTSEDVKDINAYSRISGIDGVMSEVKRLDPSDGVDAKESLESDAPTVTSQDDHRIGNDKPPILTDLSHQSDLDITNMELDIVSMPIYISDSPDDFRISNSGISDSVEAQCSLLKADSSQDVALLPKAIVARKVFTLKVRDPTNNPSLEGKEMYTINAKGDDESDDESDEDVQFVSATSSAGKKIDPRMPKPMGAPAVKSPFVRGVRQPIKEPARYFSANPDPDSGPIVSTGPLTGVEYLFFKPKLAFFDTRLNIQRCMKDDKLQLGVPKKHEADFTTRTSSVPTTCISTSTLAAGSPSTSVVNSHLTLRQQSRKTSSPSSIQLSKGSLVPQMKIESVVTSTNRSLGEKIITKTTRKSPKSQPPVSNKTQISSPRSKSSAATRRPVINITSLPGHLSRPAHVTLPKSTPNILLRSSQRVIKSPTSYSTTPLVISGTDPKLLPGNIKTPVSSRKQDLTLLVVSDEPNKQKPNAHRNSSGKSDSESLQLENLLKDSPKPKVVLKSNSNFRNAPLRANKRSNVLTPSRQSQAQKRRPPSDILAAALANSALQLDSSDSTSESFSESTFDQSPGTSFTLNHPIMTPMEVPSVVKPNSAESVASDSPIQLAVTPSNIVLSSRPKLQQILTVTSPVANISSEGQSSLITAQAVQDGNGTFLILETAGQVYSTSFASIDSSSNSISNSDSSTNLNVVTLSNSTVLTLPEEPKSTTDESVTLDEPVDNFNSQC